MSESLRADLGHYRNYLLLIAKPQWNAELEAKLDLADLVQQTLLDAHLKFTQFEGKGPAELAAWLRKILATNIADEIRALHRAKRDARLELSIEAALENSSRHIQACLAADQSSPSERAMAAEQLTRLADALTPTPARPRGGRLPAPPPTTPPGRCRRTHGQDGARRRRTAPTRAEPTPGTDGGRGRPMSQKPGVDADREARLDEVVADYLTEQEVGHAPDRAALLARHPDLAEDLAEFFADRDRLGHLIGPPAEASVPRTCPHCHALLASTAKRAACPGCGASFRLDGSAGESENLGRLGRFEIVATVGRGAFGVVYKAWDPVMSRDVALKIPRGAPVFGGRAGPVLPRAQDRRGSSITRGSCGSSKSGPTTGSPTSSASSSGDRRWPTSSRSGVPPPARPPSC